MESLPSNLKSDPKVDELLEKCLRIFPELKNENIIIRYVVVETDEIGAVKSWIEGKPTIILLTPARFVGMWQTLHTFRTFVLHELSHALNRENPDEIFEQRADLVAKNLMKALKESNRWTCEVVVKK